MWRRGKVFQAAVTQAGDNLGWEGRGKGPRVPGRSWLGPEGFALNAAAREPRSRHSGASEPGWKGDWSDHCCFLATQLAAMREHE